ncbi:YcxB family protein [Clostridium sp. MSJ-8]|uniref:YcxB family protein n=1 Tax=Clostridium sp. MSJ-8 TaxID=2841510 RepID=UPI001C0EADC4|nr:YcxB family protein [Clostridium sp. MSJ-8]MBU5486736.1 YcxB family protein [Clostridium sp. MSJ-8]
MKLKYKNNIDKLFEFYKYYLNNQKSIKKYRLIRNIIWIPIGLLISIIIGISKSGLMIAHNKIEREDIIIILLPLFIGILIVLLIKLLTGVVRRENFEDMLKEYEIDDKTLISVEVLEDGLKVKGKFTETDYSWNYVDKVVKNKDSIYIVFKDNKGLVIPIDAFKEESLKDDFCDEIEKYISK